MSSPPRQIPIEPSVLYFGTPVALISTVNEDGSTNLSPMSSVWSLGWRAVMGLSARGKAFENIQRHRECVINLPDAQLWEHVERIAPTTGVHPVPEYKQKLGYRHEADKYGLAGLTSVPSQTVRPDRIAECPIQLEAEILAVHRMTEVDGDKHADGGTPIVEARVTRVWAHEQVIIADTNHIDPQCWSPLLYVWRHFYGTGELLGINFKDDTPKPVSPS